MNVYTNEAIAIIKRCGGYREKSILAANPVFSKSETWNDSHKIVRLEAGTAGSCEVDLVSKKITN